VFAIQLQPQPTLFRSNLPQFYVVSLARISVSMSMVYVLAQLDLSLILKTMDKESLSLVLSILNSDIFSTLLVTELSATPVKDSFKFNLTLYYAKSVAQLEQQKMQTPILVFAQSTPHT